MPQGISFYEPMTVYWNGLSNAGVATLVPWGSTFSAFGSASIGIIGGDVGADPAGLYVQIPDPVTTVPTWKLVMPLAALASAMSSNSTIQVSVNQAGSATYASPNVVYANGALVAGGAIAASTTIVYVIVTPPMIQGGVFTVATLPSAVTAGAGARSFVTDANAATFNTALAGGGSNKVPVFSDGAAWHIG